MAEPITDKEINYIKNSTNKNNLKGPSGLKIITDDEIKECCSTVISSSNPSQTEWNKTKGLLTKALSRIEYEILNRDKCISRIESNNKKYDEIEKKINELEDENKKLKDIEKKYNNGKLLYCMDYHGSLMKFQLQKDSFSDTLVRVIVESPQEKEE